MSDDARAGMCARHWRIICIAAAVLISAAGWMRLRIDSSLEPLLPEDSDARRTVLFLRDSSFAAKAILWFRLTGNGTTSDLYAAADSAEKMLDPNLITRVVHPPAVSSAMDEAMGLMDDAPSLLNAADFADLQAAITPDALRQRMRQVYLQLIEPAGSIMAQMDSRDPLGIDTRILTRLSALTSGIGFKVQIKDGRFLHTDGRQLMMILETSASATSLQSSKAIADNLEKIAAAAPPGIEIIPICAQIHTAQNDALMERDIHRAAVINSIAFLLLFLFVSRDFRVAVVFLLPLATTVIAIGLCALVHPSLSTMMLGLAISMAGSAVDYGIFVYTAVTLGSVSRAQVLKLWRPLVISHLTTLGVFVAFLFSRIPGFRELGWLTSISLVMSLFAAIFILPRMIRPGGRLALLGRGMPLTEWATQMAIPKVFLTLGFLAAAVFAARIGIDPDITRLDGASDAVKQSEIDFQKTWGQSDQQMAILIVNGKTEEAAAEANDEAYDLISPHFADGGISSLASFWPSQATQRANEARWREFWTPARIAKLRTDLTAAAAPYDFSADAFEAFFRTLSNPPRPDTSPKIIQSFQDQFVARSADGGWQDLSFFADTPQNITAVRSLLGGRDDAEVISRGALNQAFAESASSETRVLVAVSIGFIAISLLILTRSIGQSAIIMLPAATGILAMLAALVICGLAMNIVSVVAAILVLALGSDYGVFALYAWNRREPILGTGMSSVHLSFLTTLAGTGAMLLARHPALFIVGVSMTSGIVGAYLTAVIMIPAICRMWDRAAARETA